MSFLDRVLQPPTYGYANEVDGTLIVPSRSRILAEFRRSLDVFASRKNWITLMGWTLTLSLSIPLALFFATSFSWTLLLVGFVYGMVVMGSHGTIWLHRYCAHRAYRFSRPIYREICRNLSIKIIPEEIYAVSHAVHHAGAEKPGDPYNARGGFLYCFLADAIHNPIRRDLAPAEYARVCRMIEHTGVRANSYAQYQRWGSICHPARTLAHYALNWGFWYGTFFLIGGHPLALALFGWAGVWAIGVRTFNFDGHGRGKDTRREGSDFHREDWSVNQAWPGFVAGEWHNNHHLYPNSARCGFLPYQLDLPWIFIRTWQRLGWVSQVRDDRADFFARHYAPYLDRRGGTERAAPAAFLRKSSCPSNQVENSSKPILNLPAANGGVSTSK